MIMTCPFVKLLCISTIIRIEKPIPEYLENKGKVRQFLSFEISPLASCEQ